MQDSMGCLMLDAKPNAAEPSSTDRLCLSWATDSFKTIFTETELDVIAYA